MDIQIFKGKMRKIRQCFPVAHDVINSRRPITGEILASSNKCHQNTFSSLLIEFGTYHSVIIQRISKVFSCLRAQLDAQIYSLDSQLIVYRCIYQIIVVRVVSDRSERSINHWLIIKTKRLSSLELLLYQLACQEFFFNLPVVYRGRRCQFHRCVNEVLKLILGQISSNQNGLI